MSNEKEASAVQYNVLAIDDLPASWKARFEKGLDMHREMTAYDKKVCNDYADAVQDQMPSGKVISCFYKWGDYKTSIETKSKRSSKAGAMALIPKK